MFPSCLVKTEAIVSDSVSAIVKTEDYAPEGYTAEEWAGMRRVAELLSFGGGEVRPQKQCIQSLRDGKSYVYFIGGDSGAVKIGVSIAPVERATNLSLCSPIPLRILAKIEGERFEEKAYHQRFSAHRLHGEWFERCPEIEAEIERLNA